MAVPIYDVAIIGTGPAGGLAAVTLAKSGARVLILEKEKLPRTKACGGALSKGPVDRLLDWNFDSVIAARCGSIRYLLNYERDFCVERQKPITFVNRTEFDLHLVERALSLSPSTVTLIDDCDIRGLEQEDGHVQLTSRSGQTFSARFVIDAGGVSGPGRKAIGRPRPVRMAPSIDVEVGLDPKLWDEDRNRVTFNFDCVSGGYGWSFPKDDHLSCGVASWDRTANVKGSMETYLERNFPTGSVKSRIDRGHPIPLYHDHEPLSQGHILLAGDAANLVDPYLGEGIRYALHSGKIAALHVLNALENGPDSITTYSQEIHDQIGQHLKAIRLVIQPLMIKAPEIFYRTFIEQSGSMSALTDLLSGSSSSSVPFKPAYGGE